MPASSMTLRTFLATARAALTSAAAENAAPVLTFVVGNESADLDSMCSAVILAYLRTVADTHATGGHHARNLHIPLSNLPREDLALRPEMKTVLNYAGLEPSDLLTLSDLPDNIKSDSANRDDVDETKKHMTRWILVDHNALTGPLSRFARSVSGCIDHHVDEGAVPPDADPRLIEQSGSCMSLIIDQTKSIWESIALAEAEQEKLARLSLAPVLIDTVMLQNKDKTRPKDVAAAEFLEARIHGDQYDRTRYYEEIHSIKEDLSPLGLRDILRKDYKEWYGIGQVASKLKLGISSVAQNLDYLVNDKAEGDADQFSEVLGAWADERELDLAAVTTSSYPNGEYQRNLLVWGRSDAGVAALGAFLEEAGVLKLETWRDGLLDKSNVRKAWRQYNLAASRKQVGPMLRDALGRGRSEQSGSARTEKPGL